MSAEAEIVTNSPSREVRIETSPGAAPSAPDAASAKTAVRTNAGPMDILTACPRRTFPRNRLLHAGSPREREDRVAIAPRGRERCGLAPRKPLVAQVLGGIK